MSTDVQHARDEPGKVQEQANEQLRQTLALESLANSVEALRHELRSISNALSRIANRIGRSD